MLEDDPVAAPGATDLHGREAFDGTHEGPGCAPQPPTPPDGSAFGVFVEVRRRLYGLGLGLALLGDRAPLPPVGDGAAPPCGVGYSEEDRFRGSSATHAGPGVPERPGESRRKLEGVGDREPRPRGVPSGGFGDATSGGTPGARARAEPAGGEGAVAGDVASDSSSGGIMRQAGFDGRGAGPRDGPGGTGSAGGRGVRTSAAGERWSVVEFRRQGASIQPVQVTCRVGGPVTVSPPSNAPLLFDNIF